MVGVEVKTPEPPESRLPIESREGVRATLDGEEPLFLILEHANIPFGMGLPCDLGTGKKLQTKYTEQLNDALGTSTSFS